MLGIETILLEDFKSFLHSINERQAIAHKKIEKYDGQNVFL